MINEFFMGIAFTSDGLVDVGPSVVLSPTLRGRLLERLYPVLEDLLPREPLHLSFPRI